ncbi:MAG TPA: N-6 DNA methylase, partial [Tissierellaceae bacterium]
MKRQILNYLKQHNLTDTKVVDSLIVSVFLRYKDIEVKNNCLLIEYLEHPFKNKESLIQELLEIISKQENAFGFEELIQLFEFVISPADRIVNGAIYTPKIIRDFIINQTVNKNNAKSLTSSVIVDIACGCGAFLFDVAILLKRKTQLSYQKIFEENLYGLDIEAYSIARTKLLLSLLALSEGEDANFTFNLFIGDALSFVWQDHINSFQGFDFILGNPPYVASRHLTDETRKLITKRVTCQSGNPDLYIPFFE